MYKPYYKLSLDPFQLRHESAFFWAGKWHSSILEELRAAILEKRGFFALTSPEGFGKTCLVETLIERLEDRVESSYITLKNDSIINFYNTILVGFGIGEQVATKIQFYLQITDCLQKIRQRNRIGLLVVDNAHLLSQELLEELRHVSNIENDGVKLINVFLVGDEGINALLNEPQNSALRQNIMFHGEVPTFSDVEIREYVEHRLLVAGTSTRIFSDNAFKQLAIYSDGVVKGVNILCETALTIGCKRGKQTIDAQTVLDAAKELKLQPSINRAAIEGRKKNNSSKNTALEGKNSENERFDSPKKIKNWTLTVIVSSLVTILCLFYLFPELLKFPLIGTDSSVEIGIMMSEVATNVDVKDAEDTNKEDIEPVQQAEGVQADQSVVSNVFDVGDEIKKTPSEIVLDSEKLQDYLKNPNEDDIIETVNQTDPTFIAGETSEDGGDAPKAEIEVESSSEVIKSTTDEAVVTSDVYSKTANNTDELQSGNDVGSEGVVPPSIEVYEPEGEVDLSEEQLTIAPTSSKVVVFLLEGKLILETKPNSSEITKIGLRELDVFAGRLLQHPKATIQIEGYISSKSNSLENIKLSERRANIVKDYLLAKGIAEHQMIVKGMGNQNPRASNNTYEGRKKNRRVEITVINDLCHSDE